MTTPLPSDCDCACHSSLEPLHSPQWDYLTKGRFKTKTTKSDPAIHFTKTPHPSLKKETIEEKKKIQKNFIFAFFFAENKDQFYQRSKIDHGGREAGEGV